MKQPTEKNIECNEIDFKAIFLSFLDEKVFHVTSQKGYEGIIQDGKIRRSGDEVLTPTYGCSQKCYANLNRCVALFDFRNFPGWDLGSWSSANPNLLLNTAYSHKPIFLVLSEKIYSELKLQDDVKKNGIIIGTYVPKVECWYPGDLDLNKFPIANVYRTHIYSGENTDLIDLGAAMEEFHNKSVRKQYKH